MPPREKVHHVKIWPENFEPVRLRIKTFEVRKNDRNYQFGDLLCLHEWDPYREAIFGDSCISYGEPKGYTGKEITFRIGHIYNMDLDTVVLSLVEVSK